jgi:hypothetical protein
MRSHELSMNPPYYPPSPEPAGCFRPSAAYHVLLCGVTASLAFALMVYVTLLVCFSAGFVVLLLAGTPLQQLLLTLPLALAVLWLGANLFPVRHAECDTGEELRPEEHRLLFDFIGSLCNELGIAPPRRVFITDNNNADALLRYHALAIGRPLVNELNVWEFGGCSRWGEGSISSNWPHPGTTISIVCSVWENRAAGSGGYLRLCAGRSACPSVCCLPASFYRCVLYGATPNCMPMAWRFDLPAHRPCCVCLPISSWTTIARPSGRPIQTAAGANCKRNDSR